MDSMEIMDSMDSIYSMDSMDSMGTMDTMLWTVWTLRNAQWCVLLCQYLLPFPGDACSLQPGNMTH